MSALTPSPYDVPGPCVPDGTDRMAEELLRSVVDVGRAFFDAAAASVALLDVNTHELVFRCVSGAGQDALIGRRFPADTGIAGWVLASGNPMIVDDLADHPVFDRDLAESTGYVPRALMAAPLSTGDQVLGVIEVLDAARPFRSHLGHLDLLALFARQAAIALKVVRERTEYRGGDPRRQVALDLLADLHHALAG